MDDTGQTRAQLLAEIASLRQRVAELERSVADPRPTDPPTDLIDGETRDELLGSTSEALRLSEENYRLLAENVTDVIWTMDMELRFQFVSPSIRQLRGYTPREVMGHSLGETVLPQSLNKLTSLFALRTLLAKSGDAAAWDPVVFEVAQRCKDGRTIFTSNNAKFVKGPDGQPYLIVGVTHDVTERRHAEHELAKLAAVVKHSSELINLATIDGQMSFINEAGTKMLGIEPSDASQVNIMDVIPDRWKEKVEREVLPKLLDGGTWEGELQFRHLKTGELVDVHAMTFSILHPDTGDPQFLANVSRDISDRKRAEREKAKLEEQYRQAQKMEALGRLAGGMAHDFNNVLCAITGNAGLALEDLAPGDPLTSELREISTAAKRGADLTRQLLVLSRRQVIEPKVINLSHLVDGLHKMLERLIGEDILLKTVAQEKLGSVRVDPGQVEQIVLNLAINARDAMPDGGELIIETADVVLDGSDGQRPGKIEPGAYVLLSVSDTGCGMNAEIREKMFDPFFTTKPVGQGTGLGLATVFSIVEQSNGKIEVASEPGKGTTFRLYFSRVAGAAEAATRPDQPKPTGGRETLLVVEDDDAVRKLAVRMLRRLGYAVLDAGAPADAIQLAEQHQGSIELLLTDVVMPHMNGRQLAARLTELRPGLKVLFTSGHTQDIIGHHGVLDEGTEFIAKPYSLDTLAARVRQVIDLVS